MSLRNLFSNGVVSSIPAVSTASPGQALTVNADKKLEWITPGAGPSGPIQGVEGTPGQIIADPPNASGIVTLSLPSNILTSALTLAYDTAEPTSGYTLPATTEDITGNQLVSGAQYVMQFAAPTVDTPGIMTFALAGEGTAGVSSITTANGITANPTTGEVVLGLGNIVPLSVTSADINATNLIVGTNDNAYKLPTTADGLASGKYVMTLASGTTPPSFTFAQETQGIISLTEGQGIIITNQAGPISTIEMSPVVVAGTSLTVGTSTNAYSFPSSNAGLVDTEKYVLQYAAGTKQLSFAPENPPNTGTVTSITAGANISVTGNANVDPTISLDTTLTGITNITTGGLNVGGVYTLPTIGGNESYVLTYGAPNPGNPVTTSWQPQGAVTAGVSSITGANGVTPAIAASGAVTVGLANITPQSVDTPSVTATTSITIGNAAGSYKLPTGNVGLADTGKYVLEYNSGLQQFAFTAESTAGTGTVSVVTSGNSNITIENNENVDPEVTLSDNLTNITSIETGAISAGTVTIGSGAGEYILPVPTTALTVAEKYVMQYAAGGQMSFVEATGSTGITTINGEDGIGANTIGGVTTLTLSNITPAEVTVGVGAGAYQLPNSAAAGDIGYVLELAAGTPLRGQWVPKTPIAVGTPLQIEVDSSSGTQSVISFPEVVNISLPDTVAITTTGGLEVSTDFKVLQTKTPAGVSTTSIKYEDPVSHNGFQSDDTGFQVLTSTLGATYKLPTALPTSAGQVLSCTGTTGATTCDWIPLPGGGGAVNLVTGTTNRISAAPTSGDVVLNIPLDFDLSLPAVVTAPTTQTINIGDLYISQQSIPGETQTYLKYQSKVSNYGFSTDQEGSRIFVGATDNYLLPTVLPAEGNVLTCSAVADGEATCAWAPQSGGSINSVTGTPNQIETATASGAVTISLPNTVNMSAPANPPTEQTRQFQLGNFSVTQTAQEAVNNTNITCQDPTTNIGFEVTNNGFRFLTGTANNSYTMPVGMPTAAGQVIVSGIVAGGGTACTWAPQSGGAVSSVTGTTNRISTNPASGIGTVTLNIPNDFDLTLPESPTLNTQIIKLSDFEVEQLTGEAPETVISYQDATTKLGFEANKQGVTIYTGPTGTNYTLPTNQPTAGQILSCSSATGNDALTSWVANTTFQSYTPPIDITLAGYGISGPAIGPYVQVSNVPLGGDTTAGAGQNRFAINFGAFGASKFIYIDWDLFNGTIGCLFQPPDDTDPTLKLTEIRSVNIDITARQYLVPQWLPDGGDMVIGTLPYYSLIGDSNEVSSAYGLCTVTLSHITTPGPPATNNIFFRFTLLPKGTVTNAIIDNSYGVSQGNRIMISSFSGLKVPGTPLVPLSNYSTSGKSYFSYV